MMLQIKYILLLCVVASVSPSAVSAAEQLSWSELGVTAQPSDDPFFGLGAEQKSNLEVILRASERRKRGVKMDEKLAERETQSRETLEEAGFDVDALVSKEARFRSKLVMQRTAVRTELDGRDIRIAGYLLPLEFDGINVRDFLLVPYVGACIHVPPPPPSQIIHVTNHEAFSVRGLFTPVWVVGKLSVRQSSLNVGLSDGSSKFDVGYAMAAKSVEPYE